MPRAIPISGPDGSTVAAYVFWCPGCEERHLVNVDASAGRASWEFSGTLEEPTFRPSLRLAGVCHALVSVGWIEFFEDCRHSLAGWAMPLPEIEEKVEQIVAARGREEENRPKEQTMSVIRHNGKEYQIPDGVSAKDAFESLKAAVPELSNATLTKDGENYNAVTSYGNKG
jgi:hypothetical protein